MTQHIPEEKVDEVIRSINIIDIVSDYVALKKAGRNLVGLCPFHTEKTPSFTVSPEKQIYYCFGCGQGGDVLSFYIKKEGYSFPQAIMALAERYGIEIPKKELTPSEKRELSEKESLYHINEKASAFFYHHASGSDKGQQARIYIDKRGLSQEMVDKFQIGYAPDEWDSLIRSFTRQNISLPLLEKAGLIIPKSKGNGYYDRFRNRLMFPIYDAYEHIIGFGGRALDGSLPKYLNSPETVIFHKGNSLYGIHTARNECRLTRTCYIVEGYFDAISLYMYGIKNVVATLGTALTSSHIRTIQGIIGKSGTIVLVFDSDDAGIKAAERSIPLFEESVGTTKVLLLPPNHDPDSFIQKNGAEAFHKASHSAKSVISFLLEMAIRRFGLSIEGKIQIIDSLKTPIRHIGDSLRRSLYIQKIAEHLNVDQTVITKKIEEGSSKEVFITKKDDGPHTNRSIQKGKPTAPSPERKYKNPEGNRLELQIVVMMLHYPKIIDEIKKRHLIEKIGNSSLKAIGKVVMEHLHDKNSMSKDIINKMEDSEQKNLLASLMITDESWNEQACIKILSQFETSCIRRNQNLINRIKEAEASNDMELLQRLLMEKQNQAIKKTKLNRSSQEAKSYGENT